MNPRALRQNPSARCSNPRALGVNPRSLKNAFYALRQENAELASAAAIFESCSWGFSGGAAIRRTVDGSELRVYPIEGSIQVELVDVDGNVSRYARSVPSS